MGACMSGTRLMPPRRICGAQRLLRPLRIGASRAPRVLCGAQRLLRPFRARLVFAGPLGSIRIASSMSPTRLLRPLGFASSTSVARVLWCPAFVATPRIREFHICCARLMVPSVCCNPTDLRVPHLLRASYGARPPLLRPFRSLSAARVLWCPAFATTHQIHVCCARFMVPSVC